MCRFANNGYNMRPPRPPRKGALFTIPCGKCGGRIHPGVETYSTQVVDGSPMRSCPKCNDAPMIPGAVTHQI